MARVIINADDFGLTDGVCKGILSLFAADAISTTTLMAAADGALRRSERLGARQLAGRVGVHLQLSGGVPISPANEVPSLVDRATGRFLPRELISVLNADEVYLEWSRQIEVVADLLAAPPTHLDSHQGVARLPECIDVYVSLAELHGLPVRGGGQALEQRMRSRGVLGTLAVIRDWTGRDLGACDLIARVDHAASQGSELIEIVTHPGLNDSDLESISGLNAAREGDLRTLHELTLVGWPNRHGHSRITFREIRDAL